MSTLLADTKEHLRNLVAQKKGLPYDTVPRLLDIIEVLESVAGGDECKSCRGRRPLYCEACMKDCVDGVDQENERLRRDLLAAESGNASLRDLLVEVRDHLGRFYKPGGWGSAFLGRIDEALKR